MSAKAKSATRAEKSQQGFVTISSHPADAAFFCRAALIHDRKGQLLRIERGAAKRRQGPASRRTNEHHRDASDRGPSPKRPSRRSACVGSPGRVAMVPSGAGSTLQCPEAGGLCGDFTARGGVQSPSWLPQGAAGGGAAGRAAASASFFSSVILFSASRLCCWRVALVLFPATACLALIMFRIDC